MSQTFLYLYVVVAQHILMGNYRILIHRTKLNKCFALYFVVSLEQMQIFRLYIENIFVDVVVLDEFFISFSMDVKLAEVNLLGVNPPLYSQNV